MWKMVYRWLAKVSGGPTIEGFDKVYGYWVRGVDDRLSCGVRIEELNALLAESEAKVRELENNCQVYCDAIDDQQERIEEYVGLIDEISRQRDILAEDLKETAAAHEQAVEQKEALHHRWMTSCETLKQQRDAALDDLASIQQQTAKYVRP